MSLPNRVLIERDHIYYGFGPDSRTIQYVTSEHTRGKEPAQIICLFGRHWMADSGWYVNGGKARMQWVPIE